MHAVPCFLGMVHVLPVIAFICNHPVIMVICDHPGPVIVLLCRHVSTKLCYSLESACIPVPDCVDDVEKHTFTR